jgi:hypothetical protein
VRNVTASRDENRYTLYLSCWFYLRCIAGHDALRSWSTLSLATGSAQTHLKPCCRAMSFPLHSSDDASPSEFIHAAPLSKRRRQQLPTKHLATIESFRMAHEAGPRQQKQKHQYASRKCNYDKSQRTRNHQHWKQDVCILFLPSFAGSLTMFCKTHSDPTLVEMRRCAGDIDA